MPGGAETRLPHRPRDCHPPPPGAMPPPGLKAGQAPGEIWSAQAAALSAVPRPGRGARRPLRGARASPGVVLRPAGSDGNRMEGGHRRGLIVFACDGVLVDSELLACRVQAWGAYRICAFVHARWRGETLPRPVAGDMKAELEVVVGRPLPPDHEARCGAELSAAFRRELRPVPGIRLPPASGGRTSTRGSSPGAKQSHEEVPCCREVVEVDVDVIELHDHPRQLRRSKHFSRGRVNLRRRRDLSKRS